MFQFDDTQFDAVLIEDDAALAGVLADGPFRRHPYYADMPRVVRMLLADAAVRESKAKGMDTLRSIALFVEAMVEMTPRFHQFPPFDGVFRRGDLTGEQKIDLITADRSVDDWDAVLRHLERNDDWHTDYWDENVDWSVLEGVGTSAN